MGLQRQFQKRVKNISIICIVVNLFLILISQCYLLFQGRGTSTNNTDYSNTMSRNPKNIKQFSLQKDFCLHHINAQKKKLYYKNNYRIEYVTIVRSASLMEVFVDLPINILLFYAVHFNRKKLMKPWLLFNGIRIIGTAVVVCLFVIFVIIGVDQFNASHTSYDGVITSEDSNQIVNTEKRYNS